MKFLLPILTGSSTVVLATTFFFSEPIKKVFKDSNTQQVNIAQELESKSVSNKIILVEDEITNIEEIRKKKQIIYDVINEVMEVKDFKKREFLKEMEIKDEDILEQIPAEKPKWIFETPSDPTKLNVYYVGESIGEEKYEVAFEKAKMNSMIELCQFIKKRVDMDTQNIKVATSQEISQKLIRKIAMISKNTFMRETKVADRYYLKLKPNKEIKTSFFQMFVLLSYPKKNIDDALKESLIYEKELLQNLVSEEELKKLNHSIENFGKESDENELKKQADHERKLLFSKYKIENLYNQSMRAEEIEKKGKLLAAYREYMQVLNKIETILNTK